MINGFAFANYKSVKSKILHCIFFSHDGKVTFNGCSPLQSTQNVITRTEGLYIHGYVNDRSHTNIILVKGDKSIKKMLCIFAVFMQYECRKMTDAPTNKPKTCLQVSVYDLVSWNNALLGEVDDTEQYSRKNSTVFFHGMLATEPNTARKIIFVFVGQHLVRVLIQVRLIKVTASIATQKTLHIRVLQDLTL